MAGVAFLALAGCGTVHATQATTPAKAAASPAESAGNPAIAHRGWLAYATDVNPGSAISFVSAHSGWRVTGQLAAPHLDGNLTAGPNGETFSWPGSGVAASADGGQNWHAIYSAPDGIWGLDLISPEVGWVVGVTTLASTGDGGASWRRLAEPAGHPLVSVSFSSVRAGIGITTAGQVVRTENGGLSWAPVSFPEPAGALCFASAQRGYISAQNGDLYRTSSGGGSWALVHATTFRSAQISYTPLWSEIACAGSNAWQAVSVVAPIPPPGHDPYAVYATHDGGASWSVVADNANGAEGLRLPAAPQPFGFLGGMVALPSGGVELVGWPASGWGLRAYLSTGVPGPVAAPQQVSPPRASGTVTAPDAPQMSEHYLSIHGIAASGGTTWLYYDDSAVGTASTVKSEALVIAANGNGASWSTRAISDQHTYH